MNPIDALKQPLESLQGIGPQTAKKFNQLGISQVSDLLFHLPIRYEDRTRIIPLGALQPGSTALVCGTIELTDIVGRNRRSLVCTISDGTGLITLRFFHFTAAQKNTFQLSTRISCFGEIRSGFSGLEIIHPEYKILKTTDECATETALTPVYPLTEGLRQPTVRKAVTQALDLYNATGKESELLPQKLLTDFNFPGLRDALYELHAPRRSINASVNENEVTPALQRLAFEEFLAHHLSLKQSRLAKQQRTAPALPGHKALCRQFIASLPFSLTRAQQRVIKEVSGDCGKNYPMMRLLQGDVGSGKTVIAAYAALIATSSGYQVAMMAPTELLAEQHYHNFKNWMKPLHQSVALLTSQNKGKAKDELLRTLVEGETGIIIGTHALFQEKVEFARLGLVVIDEQHRFGVHQRLALREKGQRSGTYPHQLVMTATPIPRTLAMLNYSDLNISTIDELPPGRTPVATRVISSEKRDEVIAKIKGWIKTGRQAYWVCTLIEESEALQCEAAENTLETLSQVLPGLRIKLVHGRMKATDKENIMRAFKEGKIDLLVATTVIEVGVDVPNAGLMIIENPERLGLAQLHQLRGRVGRGPGESYCLLMYQVPLTGNSKERLSILRNTSNGFIIADQDLKLRGPGDVMGTRQTGQMQFKIANLQRDETLIPHVQEAADYLIEKHPEIIPPLIRRWLGQQERFADV